MKLLVTGATGFLGQHLLAQLAARHPHAEICVVVRNRATWAAGLTGAPFRRVQVIEAKLTEVDTIVRAWEAQALPGAGAVSGHHRAVVHLAAAVHHSRNGGAQLFADNVEGTAGMVAVARATGARLLFVSTSGTVACAADVPRVPVLEGAPHCAQTVGRWPYYASKIACEKLVHAAQRDGGLQATILRPPVMLGPGDHRFRATSLIVRYLRGKLPFYLSGGMHFIDIRDAAAALVTALELERPAPVYHLTGWAGPLRDYFAMLHEISGVPAPKHRLPGPLAWALAKATFGKLFDPVVIEMGQHHWNMGESRAAELGFCSRPPLTTLADTVAWLRQAHPALR